MNMPPAFWQQDQLAKEIGTVKESLGSEVVDLRYKLDRDWSGDPAIFFEIVLPDSARANDPTLRRSRHLTFDIEMALRPVERWGVLPYFSLVTNSEDLQTPKKAAA